MPFRIFNQYYPIRNLLFVMGEGVVIYASVVLAILFADGILVSGMLVGTNPVIDWAYLSAKFNGWLCLKVLLVTLVCQICLYYNDLYDLNKTPGFSEMSLRMLLALGIATIFLSGIYLIFPEVIIGSGSFFAMTLAFLMLFIVLWRFFCTLVFNQEMFDRKIIILGSGELARNIMNEIMERKNCGYMIAGIALESHGDADSMEKREGIRFFSNEHQDGLYEMANRLGVKKVVVALRDRRSEFPTKELLECRISGMDVIEGDSFYEMLTGKLSVEHINPEWLIFSKGFRKSFLTRFLKRTLDIVLSLVMLVTFFPVIAITAILIKMDSKGSVLFSQERVGEKRRIYQIHKFRSMITDAEKETGPKWAGENDPRVTRMGRLIRQWRVDEIPQLWNVLKGEMSFVGPRPEREFFVKGLEYIIPYYGARFTAKPGITGWAQVCYGYGASVKDAIEKLNYDLFYMKNMSIGMDIIIVLRTVKTVISGIGR